MANRLVCDIDGTFGDDVRNVKFAIDGVPYAIDLSAASLTKMLRVLEPFTSKATKLTDAPSTRLGKGTGKTIRAASITYDKEAFKAWATVNGKWTGKRPAGALITEFLAQQS